MPQGSVKGPSMSDQSRAVEDATNGSRITRLTYAMPEQYGA